MNFNILKKQKRSENVCAKSNQSDKQFIKFFEQQLPEEMFQKFKEAERARAWNGEVKNEGLFQYWLKIKGETGNIPNKVKIEF